MPKNHDDDAPKGGRRRRKPPVPDGSGIPKELLDQLLDKYEGPGDLSDPQTLLRGLTAALVNRAMETEMDHHLGYESGAAPPEGQSNRRNGRSASGLGRDSAGRLKAR